MQIFTRATLENVVFPDLRAPEGVFFDGATLYNVTMNGYR